MIKTAENPTEKILQETKVVKEAQEPQKKQKVSISYLMKQFGEMRNKLITEKLITEEENKTLITIRENAIKKWIK